MTRGRRGDGTTPADLVRISRAAGRAGRAAGLRRPRRLRRRRPDRRHARGGDEMLGEMVGPAVANAHAEAARASRSCSRRRRRRARAALGLGLLRRAGQAATYDVDANAVKPYFELDRVLDRRDLPRRLGSTASRSSAAHDLPVYDPDVARLRGPRRRRQRIGLFVCDWFARPTKRGGAWMDDSSASPTCSARGPSWWSASTCRSRPPAQPALMTIDEVRTGFHEFGHALHGLFSDAVYPRLQGTARAPRLRRVPLPGQRDVGLVARGPRQLRRAPRDRRAARPGRRRTG